MPNIPNSSNNKEVLCQKVAKTAPNYPKYLVETAYPPALLYYRGTLRNDLFPLAVVGARKMSEYGRQTLRHIISELRNFPIVIVSGLAYGTDAYAHTLALEYDMVTWAVLASGTDYYSLYPRQHRALATQIIKDGGVLFSEFACGTKPLKTFFPRRNRIIAGLCRGVLISEAAQSSGALITSEYAIRENRDVFAIPGSIFSALSFGPHKLISRGAIPVTKAQDIIDQYPELKQTALALPLSDKAQETSGIQQKILALLNQKAMNPEQIINILQLPLQEVITELTLLEILNKVHRTTHNLFAIGNRPA